MPEKIFFFWHFCRSRGLYHSKLSNPTKLFPKFPLALAISIWPKEKRWVYTLGTAGWILTFVVWIDWQVWMRWSLLILGSSLLAERNGIRLRNESAAAKKHRIVSREKMAFFRTPSRTSWTTQKAQSKNIARKRKHDEKYMRENSPKKWPFWEFCFALALARPKKRNYFAQSRFPKYRCFFDVRGQKTAKIRPPPRWVRRHDQNMYPRKGKMSSGEIPKKVRFFGIFRN